MSYQAKSSVDIISAARNYIEKIVNDNSISGMKALLLDQSTTKIVSMVFTQTQILDQEVYLVEQLGKEHESMGHLKAAVYIQPTEANIDLLVKECRKPQFSEYHVFFSNVVSKDKLQRLARADEFEVIKQVQEYYGDFMAVNEDIFHLGSDNSISLSSSNANTFEAKHALDRNVKGLMSVFLSLKRRPTQIRYQGSSDLARKVASEVISTIEGDDIYEFRRAPNDPSYSGTLLLVLDRKDDPITPLLTQWTYQAMVHECMGLSYNRVSMRDAPGVKGQKDMQEIVLSITSDPFFAAHRNDNFGDLGMAIKDMLSDYQKSQKLNENIQSIEDMQNFMVRYPEIRSQSVMVTKHVALMSELARLVDVCQLLDISQLEQEMACSNDRSGHRRQTMEKLNNPRIQLADKVKLVLLYLLRYENSDDVANMKMALQDQGVDSRKVEQIDALLRYAGENKRAPGLFTAGGLMSTLGRQLKSSIHGVENVYTQHIPLMSHTIEAIAKGKLKDASYPLIHGTASNTRPSEVVIFVVGGITMEEVTKVSEFNAASASNGTNMRIVLGGSTVHNSTSFLKEVGAVFKA